MQPEEIGEASWKKFSQEIFSKIMPQCARDVVLQGHTMLLVETLIGSCVNFPLTHLFLTCHLRRL